MEHYTDWPAYPTNILNLTDFPDHTDDIDDVLAWLHNAMRAEMSAVQEELGTNPRGDFTDVKTRLAATLKIPTEGGTITFRNSSNAIILQLNDDGTINMPLRSSCRAWLNGAQDIPKDSWTKVDLNTTEWDNQTEFTGGTFTAKTAGYRLVLLQSRMDEGQAAHDLFGIRLRKNSTTVISSMHEQGPDPYITKPIATILPLAINDALTMQVNHNYSENRLISGATSTTYMIVHKLM